jgi:hypothetical protein
MPAKRIAVLQEAQIQVIRLNWCVQEHTSGIIDSSNNRGQFSIELKLSYQASNHCTLYMIHKCMVRALN